MRKRMANRWSMNGSYAYNNAIDHWDSANAYEDPTNIDLWNGYQYAPESAGSGVDSVFTNAKWLFKLNGSVTMPLEINVGAGYQARQGYPFPQSILSPNRTNRRGQIQTLLDPLGDVRLDTFQQLDVKVDRAFQFGAHSPDSGDGDLQPDERQHGAGAAPQSGGREREQRQPDSVAARHPLRPARELVEEGGAGPAARLVGGASRR